MPLLDYHSETVFLLCFIELSQVFHKDATSIAASLFTLPSACIIQLQVKVMKNF